MPQKYYLRKGNKWKLQVVHGVCHLLFATYSDVLQCCLFLITATLMANVQENSGNIRGNTAK